MRNTAKPEKKSCKPLGQIKMDIESSVNLCLVYGIPPVGTFIVPNFSYHNVLWSYCLESKINRYEDENLFKK